MDEAIVEQSKPIPTQVQENIGKKWYHLEEGKYFLLISDYEQNYDLPNLPLKLLRVLNDGDSYHVHHQVEWFRSFDPWGRHCTPIYY